MTNIIGWILAIVLALVFVLAGGVKLIGAPGMVTEFAQIGIGQWFRIVTGLVEVSGAIGLLIPKLIPLLGRVTNLRRDGWRDRSESLGAPRPRAGRPYRRPHGIGAASRVVTTTEKRVNLNA
jgi:hypothetical protein